MGVSFSVITASVWSPAIRFLPHLAALFMSIRPTDLHFCCYDGNRSGGSLANQQGDRYANLLTANRFLRIR